MQTTETYLGLLRERGKRGLPVKRVYRQLYNINLYLSAYGRIYRNAGAMTPGVTEETADAMSLEKINDIIQAVRQERYQWQPARRTYILKKNGKKRPLGIPVWSDKLLAEVMRMILNAYFDVTWSPHSHGFREERGCHTALREIYHTWKGMVWIIEADIADCFDHVNHNILLKKLWKMGIRDKRILMLIKKMLKAGIFQEIEENALGTPQGGIISPLLANVYLHEFDKYIAEQWEEHPKQVEYARKRYAYTSMAKHGYPRYYLIRYADDGVILTTSHKNAIKIKELAKQFLERNGKLQLSEEKTLITDVRATFLTFLGTETRVRPSQKGKGLVTYSRPSRKAMNGALQSLKKQAERIKHAYYRDKTIQEILRYNAMAVGIGNYWSMTSAVSQCGSRVDHRLWYKIDKIFRKITGSKLGEYQKRKIEAEKTSNLEVETCGTQNAHICPGI